MPKLVGNKKNGKGYFWIIRQIIVLTFVRVSHEILLVRQLKRLVRARTVGYLLFDRNRSVNPPSRCARNRQWRMCDCETNYLISLQHRLSRLSDNEVSLNRQLTSFVIWDVAVCR